MALLRCTELGEQDCEKGQITVGPSTHPRSSGLCPTLSWHRFITDEDVTVHPDTSPGLELWDKDSMSNNRVTCRNRQACFCIAVWQVLSVCRWGLCGSLKSSTLLKQSHTTGSVVTVTLIGMFALWVNKNIRLPWSCVSWKGNLVWFQAWLIACACIYHLGNHSAAVLHGSGFRRQTHRLVSVLYGWLNRIRLIPEWGEIGQSGWWILLMLSNAMDFARTLPAK